MCFLLYQVLIELMLLLFRFLFLHLIAKRTVVIVGLVEQKI